MRLVNMRHAYLFLYTQMKNDNDDKMHVMDF